MNYGLNSKGLAELVRRSQAKDRRGLREIADDLGLTASTISRAQNGKLPNGDSLLLILEWIHVTLDMSWNEIIPIVIYRNTRSVA